MTAKSGFYGTDEPSYRKKLVPNSDEAYFQQVNKTTGEIEVWNEEAVSDKYVGKYVKNSEGQWEFQPNNSWWGGAQENEKRFFQSDEGRASVFEHAEETVIKDKTTGRNNEGETLQPIPQEVASKQANELLTTGKEDTPDDADPTSINNERVSESLNEIRQSQKKRKGTKSGSGSFGSFRYPLSSNREQDFIKFTLLEYSPKDLDRSGSTFGFGDRARVGPSGETGGRVILGSVSLPIPGGIKDENGANWGAGDKMNEMQIQASSLARAMTGASGEDAGDAAKKIVDRIGANSSDVKKALQETLSGQAVGAQNLLSRMTGMVMNPNLELLFQEPTLRPFTFTFDLSPRSKDEAEEVIKIIKFFKQGMSPIRSESNLFLLAPNTFQVHYILKGDEAKEHPYIGKMKECAMTNFAVDYTPQQNYSTLVDGYMTTYKISMQLKELEPVFNDDYGTDDTVEIGF